MEEAIQRITKHVALFNFELAKNKSLMDFMVRDVVDRALTYMNRHDLEDEEKIPAPLERVLATTVCEAYKTVTGRLQAESGAVKSVSDQGQSVSFSEKVMSYYSAEADSSIFSSATVQLDNFRMISILESSA